MISQKVIMPDPKKIFVIHGRDSGLREDFFSFLRALELSPLEWSQAVALTGQASPYIGEILDEAFNHAQAVVVLLSPDDEVRLSSELHTDSETVEETDVQLQARPNVLFEAGMAMGRAPSRTLLIEVGKVKRFSDVGGRHVIRLKDTPESRKEIAQRLKNADCEVSMEGDDWLTVGTFSVDRTASMKTENDSASHTPGDLTNGDIIAILDNWFPKTQDARHNGVFVKYQELDKELNLPPGSTKVSIEQVANRHSFRTVSSGPNVANFEFKIVVPQVKTRRLIRR